MTAATTDLYDVMNRRRDVRAEFTGAPLDDSVLARVLHAAHSAPSVGMSQPWDFIVVESDATRAAFHSHVLCERKAFEDSLTEQRAEVFNRIKIEGIMESSVGVVVTYDDSRAGPAVLGRHASPDAGLYSVCLAIQNLWLAATFEGLGVGWVSFFREDHLRALVGIPPTVRPIAWLCLGPITALARTPDLQRHGWRSPIPLSDIVHREHYGNTTTGQPKRGSI